MAQLASSAHVHALQVYGDAVMDEAPLLIVTNFHVTVFMRRSDNVLDKKLFASEPIWFDQTDPPLRACWVHALQQAQELRDLKRRLPRAVVPPTVEVYHIEQRPQQAHGQLGQQQHATAEQRAAAQQQAATEQQGPEAGSAPGSKRQRVAEQQVGEHSSSRRSARQRTMQKSLCLQARSEKGYEESSTHFSAAPVPAAASLSHPEAEEMLLLSELKVTDELLGVGPFGYTFKVCSTHICTTYQGFCMWKQSLFLVLYLFPYFN